MILQGQPFGGLLLKFKDEAEELLIVRVLDQGMRALQEEPSMPAEKLRLYAPEYQPQAEQSVCNTKGGAENHILVRSEPSGVLLMFALQAGIDALSGSAEDLRAKKLTAAIIEQVSTYYDSLRELEQANRRLITRPR